MPATPLLLPPLVGFLAALLAGAATLGSPAAAVAAFAAAALASFFLTPVFAADFADPWLVAALALAAGGAAALWSRRGDPAGSPRRRAALLAVAAAPVPLVGLGAAWLLTTSAVLRAGDYAALLGPVRAVPFAQAVQPLDTTGGAAAPGRAVLDQSAVRLVDAEIAERRGQELLGADPGLGGAYRLGQMRLTRREGRLVFAAPLEFAGLFRWWASDGAPGYAWVDAHDPRLAALVTEAGGRPIRLRCTGSAWLGRNLERLAWAAAPGTGLTDFSFEIGPEGRPLYAVTTYAHRVGLAGADPTGVLAVDPQACTATRHDMDALPAWANRVVPSWIAEEQAGDWAALSGGWLNASPFGAHVGVRQVTPGTALLSTAAGGTAWYMGLATTGNPQGTTGFLLVDSRSKAASFFEQAGATEEGARDAILGRVAEKRGWSAALPVLYNVADRATYLALLKDGAGNLKGVGLMPVDDRNLVAVADDLPRGLLAYAGALAGRGAGGADPAEPAVRLEGLVDRVASEVVDGNTVYWLTLQGHPGLVLGATGRLGPQVALTRPGDPVRLVAQGPAGGTLAITAISNPAATGNAAGDSAIGGPAAGGPAVR